MSQQLVAQWQDRVVEVNQEIELVEEEIKELEVKIRGIEEEKKSRLDAAKNKKSDMERQLAATNAAIVQEMEELSAAQNESKSILAQRDDAMTTYNTLLELVRQLKTQEKQLATRDDPELTLQNESSSWNAQEMQLREELRMLEESIMNQRKTYAAEIAKLEKEIATEESELRSERMSREERSGASAGMIMSQPTNLNQGGAIASDSDRVRVSADGTRTISVSLGRKQSRKRDALGELTNN